MLPNCFPLWFRSWHRHAAALCWRVIVWMPALLCWLASVPGTALGISIFLVHMHPTSSVSYLPVRNGSRLFNPISSCKTVQKRGAEDYLPKSQGSYSNGELPSFLMQSISHQTIHVCRCILIKYCSDSTFLWWTLIAYESEILEGKWPSSLVSKAAPGRGNSLELIPAFICVQ